MLRVNRGNDGCTVLLVCDARAARVNRRPAHVPGRDDSISPTEDVRPDGWQVRCGNCPQ